MSKPTKPKSEPPTIPPETEQAIRSAINTPRPATGWPWEQKKPKSDSKKPN